MNWEKLNFVVSYYLTGETQCYTYMLKWKQNSNFCIWLSFLPIFFVHFWFDVLILVSGESSRLLGAILSCMQWCSVASVCCKVEAAYRPPGLLKNVPQYSNKLHTSQAVTDQSNNNNNATAVACLMKTEEISVHYKQDIFVLKHWNTQKNYINFVFFSMFCSWRKIDALTFFSDLNKYTLNSHNSVCVSVVLCHHLHFLGDDQVIKFFLEGKVDNKMLNDLWQIIPCGKGVLVCVSEF